ncbi:MAG: hypothetical protein IPF93_08565 [Saprospiraceae bacterium]|nr:hypothetical protein [Saprospiraceae bacterium]
MISWSGYLYPRQEDPNDPPYVNAGSVENKGIELGLIYKNTVKYLIMTWV